MSGLLRSLSRRQRKLSLKHKLPWSTLKTGPSTLKTDLSENSTPSSVATKLRELM
ncbi:MAG: hypothetical protein OXM87_00410 [Truepera sp.]|nr:hypothetical protein [Truepera sp.]